MSRSSTLKSQIPVGHDRGFFESAFEQDFVNTVRTAAALLDPDVTRVFVSGFDTEVSWLHRAMRLHHIESIAWNDVKELTLSGLF
jgi:hypothetical protein